MKTPDNKLFKHKMAKHHDGESWAVSYADFLMVLMSFFIIFFDAQTKTSEKNLDQLVMKLKSIADIEVVKEITKTSSRGPASVAPTGVASVEQVEKILNKEKQIFNKKGEVLIKLPDNIFKVGQYEMTPKVKKLLDNVLNLIHTSDTNFKVYIVGHTDQVKYKKSNKRIVNNNLILSSMRAAKAVEYAFQKGFSEENVFVQGLKNQSRNSRTLSIRVVEL